MTCWNTFPCNCSLGYALWWWILNFKIWRVSYCAWYLVYTHRLLSPRGHLTVHVMPNLSNGFIASLVHKIVLRNFELKRFPSFQVPHFSIWSENGHIYYICIQSVFVFSLTYILNKNIMNIYVCFHFPITCRCCINPRASILEWFGQAT